MSFAGGGSDLPSFYRRHGGAVLSAAVDKYVYVNINRKFDDGIRVAYSKTEEVRTVAEIEHKLVRAAFEMMGIPGGVEITTIADIPSRGTGLGSSSAFTVGLLNVLHAYQGRPVSPEELGRESCRVEIELCGEPIGKQDQYAAAFGGLNLIEFNPDDSVLVSPVIMPRDLREQLVRRLAVFYTGVTRSASGILREQARAVASDADKQAALRRMVRLAYELRDELGRGCLDSFGEILDANWRLKKTLSADVSSEAIDGWYSAAKDAGALGGKLLGAGAGGFLLFYAPEDRHEALDRALQPLRRAPFGIEPLGSRIIFYEPQ
jgi:D-glycero-alpha-D-manno-heptose-7-phosphate kinase